MKTLFTITIFLLSSSLCLAQLGGIKVDFSKLNASMNPGIQHTRYNYHGVKSETDFLFTSLFIFYKSFISSQDGSSCTFTPSCSEYMLEAIRKKGIIVGAMAGFDRLTRCNGLSPEKYKFDPVKKVFIDPVQ